ncbi:MAG TPA: phosphopantetheine-binding protein [Planctomycetota bacterium]|nr:phosphopantetheine-binding protein [Planctomycetota bacterium]
MEKSVEDTLREMMVERLFLKIDPATIELDANLMEVYGIDSVQVSELVVGTEATFDISFDDDDFDPTQFDTLRSIAGLVRKKLENA